MKNDWQLFNKFLLTTVFCGSLAMILMNVLVDPYSVFGTESLPHGVDANGRFMKYEAIKNNPTEYKGLILGSSRSGIIVPDDISEIRGTRYFNASYFGARPLEILEFLESLKKRHAYSPKEVILGFDLFPFIEPSMPGLSYRVHPEIKGVSMSSFLSDYIFASSVNLSLKKYLQVNEEYIIRDVENGHYSLPNFEKRIERDHEAFIQSQILSKANEILPVRMFDSSIFIDIQRLKAYLTENGITTFYYLQPISEWRRKQIPEHHIQSYQEGLHRLFSDNELVDFTFDENITSNPTLWYDLKHYRPSVGKYITRTLTKDDRHIAPTQ